MQTFPDHARLPPTVFTTTERPPNDLWRPRNVPHTTNFYSWSLPTVLNCSNLEAEAEANFWRLRPRPRPKIIMKKYQIMINNIRFKIIAGKIINKIPDFYTVFARKMPDYIIRQRDHGKAEAKCLRPRPRPRPKFWPRGHFGLEDLTSLRLLDW